VLLVVLLGALAVSVEALLGARLHAQIEDRLRDRASAAAALVGTVDSDDLADRLSMQGLSVKIVQADGAAIEAGPSPAELKKGPPDPASLPVPPTGRRSAPDTAGTGSGTGAGTDTGSGSDTGTTAGSGAATAAGVTVTSSSVREQDGVVTLVSHLSDDSTITLTTGTRSVDETLAELGWVMGGASAVFLMLAAAGLVLVVRRSLRPLDEMTATARSIAAGDRGRRLRPARRDTEIGRVATAFDEMLDAVEGAERQAVAAELRMRAFVSDAAHELRTPVAGVRAAADALVRAPLGSEDRERLASHVVRQSSRASRLVDDMLTMTRVDRGLDLDVGDLDVVEFLHAEVDRLRLRLPSLSLDLLTPDRALVVDADQDRLAQVVGNLVDNAARATAGHGRVLLEVVAPDDAADDAAHRECSAVVIRVSDDGPGVPAADRERIFDRLVRLDDDRSDRSGGAGLGLPIARGIARAHGGDVECVASTRGAVFEVRLPVPVPVPSLALAATRGADPEVAVPVP
jgi:signal transduction histidine kinase